MINPQDFVTGKEYAKLCGVHESTLRRWKEQGVRLPEHSFGKRKKYDRTKPPGVPAINAAHDDNSGPPSDEELRIFRILIAGMAQYFECELSRLYREGGEWNPSFGTVDILGAPWLRNGRNGAPKIPVPSAERVEQLLQWASVEQMAFAHSSSRRPLVDDIDISEIEVFEAGDDKPAAQHVQVRRIGPEVYVIDQLQNKWHEIDMQRRQEAYEIENPRCKYCLGVKNQSGESCDARKDLHDEKGRCRNCGQCQQFIAVEISK